MKYKSIFSKFSNPLTNREIGGSMDKTFVQLNDEDTSKMQFYSESLDSKRTMYDSVFFKELYEDLHKGHSSYVTYLNDLIIDEDGNPRPDDEICIPRYVSVMVKEIDSRGWLYSEVVGSRLARLMGIGTVYNIAPCLEDNPNADLDKDLKLLSVDCVPSGYRIEPLKDMGFGLSGVYTSINDILMMIDKNLPTIAGNYLLNLTPERVDNLKRELCKQFLFKSLLGGDGDCHSNNYAIMYNSETGDFKLAPLFDMERMFQYSIRDNTAQSFKAYQSIECINKLYPDLMKDFITRANRLRISVKLKKCMKDSMNICSNDIMLKKYKVVKNNIDYMNRYYNSVLENAMLEK